MTNGVVFTGDNTSAVGYIVVGVIALIAVVAVLILTKPKKKEENLDENSDDK